MLSLPIRLVFKSRRGLGWAEGIVNNCLGVAAGDRNNRLRECFPDCAGVMKNNGSQNGSNGARNPSVGPAGGGRSTAWLLFQHD